jgi:DNA-binding response OmpR family regulator
MAGRALIVEDEPLLSDLIDFVLAQMGYESTTLIGEGNTVVPWVKKHKPDLILLDLMLPGRSGYEICQELKLDRTTNLIPIVICTARNLRDDVARGLQVGANFYLTKPFTVEQLKNAALSAVKWRKEMEASGAQGEIHFQFSSDPQCLEELNGLLSRLLLFSPLTEDQIFQLTTAVREMGNNAIEWGNRNHVERPVTLTYRIDKEKITISIRDQGSGFNRQEMEHCACDDDPISHLEVRKEKGIRMGGLGIFMTKRLVDELEYNEAGNEVRLVKRFGRLENEPNPSAS